MAKKTTRPPAPAKRNIENAKLPRAGAKQGNLAPGGVGTTRGKAIPDQPNYTLLNKGREFRAQEARRKKLTS